MFIQLFSRITNSNGKRTEHFVNVAHIVRILPDLEGTYLWYGPNKDDLLYVKESVEQIFDMIEEEKENGNG